MRKKGRRRREGEKEERAGGRGGEGDPPLARTSGREAAQVGKAGRARVKRDEVETVVGLAIVPGLLG